MAMSSALLLGLCVVIAGQTGQGPVRFNEADFADTGVRPDRSLGLPDAIDLADPRALARFILTHAPGHAVVYPTERYYYFEFDQGPHRVAGNLRFTEIDRGILHTGYFDRNDRRLINAATFRDGDPGVRIHPTATPHTYRVEIDGIARVFTLDRTVLDAGPGVPLAPDERVVSTVRDESGFVFTLLFHEPQAMFYYALHPDFDPPHALADIPLSGHRFRVDREGGFVFWRDPDGRDVLVGVRLREIADNSYFDGPFDQVPPDLPLRPLLRRAYPYVDARGGIDEHGTFLELADQRVAISPYAEYDELGPFLQAAVAALDAEPRRPDRPAGAPLVDEPKRAFMRSLPAIVTATGAAPLPESFGAAHQPALSRTWPANHARQQSQSTASPPPIPPNLPPPTRSPANDH